jgi:RNA polymerase primary sigma factor
METSTFKEYLIAIAQYPLLTPEQEKALAYRIREGDEDAREQLINSNLRLVVYLAKNYKSNFLDLEDLVMEGNLGLFTAVDKFNPDLGNRFSTCATPWIKQAIMKAITEKGKNVRLPANVYQALNNMKKAIDALAEDGILTPTDAQIAEKMGIEEEKIALLKQWKKDTVSLSVPLGDESEDTLEDLQADTNDESPVAYAERKMDEEFVREILKDLPDRTRTIMKMRYGLGDENDPEDWQNEHTLEEIGDYLGLTRERIRQIEKQTLQELKVKFAKYSY